MASRLIGGGFFKSWISEYRAKVSENELKSCFPSAFDCSQSPESSQSPYRTELDPRHYDLWPSMIIKNLLQVEELFEDAGCNRQSVWVKLKGFMALHQLTHDKNLMLPLSQYNISVDTFTRIRNNFLLKEKCSTEYVLLCELIIKILEAVKDDKGGITDLDNISLLPGILEYYKEEWTQYKDVENNKLEWLREVCKSVRGLLQVEKVKRFLGSVYYVFEDCLKKQEVLLNTLLHNILLLLDNMEYPCRKYKNIFTKTKESMLEGIKTADRLKKSIQSAYAKECVIPDIEVEAVKALCDIENTKNYLIGKILLYTDNVSWVFTVVTITEDNQGKIRFQLWNEKAVCLMLWTCGDIEVNPGPKSRSEILRDFSTCIYQDLLQQIWEASGENPPKQLFSKPPPGWNELRAEIQFAKISDRKRGCEEIFDKTVDLFLLKVQETDFHCILRCFKIVHCNNTVKDDIESCTQKLKSWVKKRKIEKIIDLSQDEDASLLIELLGRRFREDNNIPSPELTKKLEDFVAIVKTKSEVKRKVDTESYLEPKHKRQRTNWSSSSTDIKDNSSECIPCEMKDGPRFSSKPAASESHHSNSNIPPSFGADKQTFELQVQEGILSGGHEDKIANSPASDTVLQNSLTPAHSVTEYQYVPLPTESNEEQIPSNLLKESETLQQVTSDTQDEPDTSLSPPLDEEDSNWIEVCNNGFH